MIYKVLKIEEDIDFGCEERMDGEPVKVLVTLENSLGEKKSVKIPDLLLCEQGIDEGMEVCFDKNGFLRKASLTSFQ